MKKILFLFSLMAIIFTSCIQDDIIEDFVEPVLRINNIPDTILVGTDFQFDILFLNNIGVQEPISPIWFSSSPEVISIDMNGLASALTKGQSVIRVSYTKGDIDLTQEITVNVGEVTTILEAKTEKTGQIATTSSYKLEGDFIITEADGKLLISITGNYEASTALPGLYLYLSNNKNSTNNAFEVSAVEVFSGAHTYEIDGVGINDYSHLLYFCKPFNVKVGDGEIK